MLGHIVSVAFVSLACYHLQEISEMSLVNISHCYLVYVEV